MTQNISSLFNTARLELQRKDDDIKELREKYGVLRCIGDLRRRAVKRWNIPILQPDDVSRVSFLAGYGKQKSGSGALTVEAVNIGAVVAAENETTGEETSTGGGGLLNTEDDPDWRVRDHFLSYCCNISLSANEFWV